MALEQKHYREAIRVIRSSKVDSQAIIGYLERNGFEDIALYFVTEPRARFNLAIRCGNLDIANECATQLNEPAIWNELAAEALRQGNHAIVEVCYQQTKSFEKLSFLYLVTGNRAKLQKMLEIADRRQDAMSRFFNAMYLGDASARVQLLRDVGQTTLAYITAVAYGLEEAAAAARALLEEQGFYDICISMKSSSVPVTMAAYRLLHEKVDYPLHLGVTEAGTPSMGLLKSAIGIGGLLCEGIGDTMRVSLTADPVEEVYAAKRILQACGIRRSGVNLVSCPTCGRTAYDMIPIAEELERRLADCKKNITVAVMGCVVNGPGEAHEADYGIAGGKDCGLLFRRGKILGKYPADKLADALVDLILSEK